MAIRPEDEYSAQTESGDSGYPHGKAQNVTNPGDGTGTPLEQKWVNDLWGFLQSLIERANITPSGNPDEVGASQYMNALERLLNLQAMKSWTDPQTISALVGGVIVDYGYDPFDRVYYAVATGGSGSPDVASSSDHGKTWGATDVGTSSLRAILTGIDSTEKAIVVGDNGQVWQWDGSQWVDRAPGTGGHFLDIVAHKGDVFIVGQPDDVYQGDGGVSTGLATETIATTATMPSAASNGTDIVVVTAAGEVFRRDDSNASWNQDTVNNPPAEFLSVGASTETGIFLAIAANGSVYRNEPGSTDWNAVNDLGSSLGIASVACDGRGLWVISYSTDFLSEVEFSKDDGDTWHHLPADITGTGYAAHAGDAFWATKSGHDFIRSHFSLSGASYG